MVFIEVEVDIDVMKIGVMMNTVDSDIWIDLSVKNVVFCQLNNYILSF